MKRDHVFAAIVAALNCATVTLNATQTALLADFPETAKLLRAPPPQYPLDARRQRLTGSGIFLLRVQISTGVVNQVLIGRSTGVTMLDAAAVKAFRQWRFKPGTLQYRKITSVRLSPPQTRDEALIKVPATFTLTQT